MTASGRRFIPGWRGVTSALGGRTLLPIKEQTQQVCGSRAAGFGVNGVARVWGDKSVLFLPSRSGHDRGGQVRSACHEGANAAGFQLLMELDLRADPELMHACACAACKTKPAAAAAAPCKGRHAAAAAAYARGHGVSMGAAAGLRTPQGTQASRVGAADWRCVPMRMYVLCVLCLRMHLYAQECALAYPP
eukprot:1159010-Pelagomonas_calceolata.AAC.15